MKVAVCNSVGIDADGYAMIHSPSRWTNSTKDLNIFTYYPWQLAYCSSILKRDTDHEVKFFDGCLDKLDHDAFVEKVSEFAPDYLVMDCATRTIDADSRFGIEIKLRFGTKLIFCGPHPTTFPEEVSKYADMIAVQLDDIEHAPLHDITSHIVYTHNGHRISHSWVNGQLLMKDRELTTLNTKDVANKAHQWQEKLAP